MEDLADHFTRLGRDRAVDLLEAAVDQALIDIETPSTSSKDYPSTYTELAKYGLQWIHRHIYWIGYGRASDGVMTIANVIWDRADIPARAQRLAEDRPD